MWRNETNRSVLINDGCRRWNALLILTERDREVTYCKVLRPEFTLCAVVFQILRKSVEYVIGSYAGQQMDYGPKCCQQGHNSHRQRYGDLVQKYSSMLSTVHALMTLQAKHHKRPYVQKKMPESTSSPVCHRYSENGFFIKSKSIFCQMQKRHSLFFWSCGVLSQCTEYRKWWTATDRNKGWIADRRTQ